MIKRSKKIYFILFFIIALNIPVAVFAGEPYKSYNYNSYNEPVPAPYGYTYIEELNGKQYDIGAFNTPQDMFVSKDKKIYILDSGNKRVVILDSEYKLIRVIDKFKSAKGMEELNGPKGIFVDDDGLIYIADTGNSRVLITDIEGNIKNTMVRPNSDLFPKELQYQPIKVVVTSSKTVYVLCYGMYRGALIYSSNGDFKGFYGSNKVTKTAALLADFFWRKILSKQQIDQMARYVPIEYSSFDIDEEDFVYTCTSQSDTVIDQIKKLNPSGINVLKPNGDSGMQFGDLKIGIYKGQKQNTIFADVNIEDNNFINCLDSSRGRIFQYNQDGDLLFVFGGIGNQKGTFLNPVSIESLNQNILVLDSKKNSISIFALTQYGSLLHDAINMYSDGIYQKSIPLWMEVLKYNSFSKLAYRGIAKAYMQTYDYKNAMKYFKLCNDKRWYSMAFKQFRVIYMRKHFSTYTISIILLIILLKLNKRFKFSSKIINCIKRSISVIIKRRVSN